MDSTVRHCLRHQNQALNKKDMAFIPESYLLHFQQTKFKHVIYFVNVEATQSSQGYFKKNVFLLPVSMFFFFKRSLHFLATKHIVLKGHKDKKWKYGTFRIRVIYHCKLC